jgi:hypothetical protein
MNALIAFILASPAAAVLVALAGVVIVWQARETKGRAK